MMKQPDDYFLFTGVSINQPTEPATLFAKRSIGFELWCHVCESLTTYDEVFCLPMWDGYRPCPECGLYATLQDIT